MVNTYTINWYGKEVRQNYSDFKI